MDKKTLGLLAVLGFGIAFLYFFSNSQGININQFVQFGEYMEKSGTPSAKTSFKELNVTPTPSLSPYPSMPPP